MESFLLIAFVLLITGVIAVPLASKFGLGSVLGYLIAGIVLAPVLVGLGVDIVSLQHFAEFGVVMMLFLVGLELEPKLLWEMRAKLLGLGGMQVLITMLLVAAGAMAFGLHWSFALAIGMVLALSSTAIVLQTLNEKGLMRSDGGNASFSVLLFQDIAVIPMLALLPLIAMPDLVAEFDAANLAPAASVAEAGHGETGHADPATADHAGEEGSHGESMSLVDGLPGWAVALVNIGAIAAVYFAGSYLTGPIFRFVSLANLRELFVATALMLVIGIALLMTLVGLSPALGTFLAGVVLANSEYRHELESDIDPFRGLLLGLFFITVGARIDFGLLLSNLSMIVGLTLGVMVLKGAVLYLLARIFRIQGSDRWLFTLGLAQAGEFGFVLLSFVVAGEILPQSIADPLLLVVALSMLLTPALFIFYERVIVPKFIDDQSAEADEIDARETIIIAGHGRMGGIVNRMARQAGLNTVVLDHSMAQLDMLRTFGLKVFYGDATRPDLLHAAGIEDAKIFVICIDDKEQTTELARYVAQNHPHVHVTARARDRNHVYELYAAGCRDIIRETFDSGVRMGRSMLEANGMHPYQAERVSREFVDRDRYALVQLAELYDPDVPIHENPAYVAKTRELVAEQEAQLLGEALPFSTRADRGWTPPAATERAEAEKAAGQTVASDS